jgi:gluconolactonase
MHKLSETRFIGVAILAAMMATTSACAPSAGPRPLTRPANATGSASATGTASSGAPAASVKAEAPEFAAVVGEHAVIRQVAAGYQFTEGPAWHDGKLIFSDIATDTMYQWSPGKEVAVFRRPSHDANGNTIDARGRLITCEQGARSVTRTDEDGKVVTLADPSGGRRLNSPNDVAVKSDGSIWFTDPAYGIKASQKELEGCWVFRIDPGAKEPVPVIRDIPWPNGICFSPDEKFLYVGNSDAKDACIRRYVVRADNTLGDCVVFARIAPGIPDGIRTDSAGRLYVTAGDGVQVYGADGKLLGRILTPEAAANCCFGGRDGRTLFITARTSVWMVELKVRGQRRRP